MVELIGYDEVGASIEVVPGSPPTIAVSGEIDFAVGDWFSAELARHVAAASGTVVLDLSGVTFMDSSGIAVLLATARATEFRICAASPAVRRVIELTGLADALQLAP
jgi:anti-sigma B factor antagonist